MYFVADGGKVCQLLMRVCRGLITGEGEGPFRAFRVEAGFRVSGSRPKK